MPHFRRVTPWFCEAFDRTRPTERNSLSQFGHIVPRPLYALARPGCRRRMRRHVQNHPAPATRALLGYGISFLPFPVQRGASPDTPSADHLEQTVRDTGGDRPGAADRPDQRAVDEPGPERGSRLDSRLRGSSARRRRSRDRAARAVVVALRSARRLRMDPHRLARELRKRARRRVPRKGAREPARSLGQSPGRRLQRSAISRCSPRLRAGTSPGSQVWSRRCCS